MRSTPPERLSWPDVLAGLSVALVLIPQSMAYAELAGLPPHHGLYAAGLPLIAAAFLASSPYLQTGPVALTGLLTLGALQSLEPLGTVEYAKLAALLALVVGVARILVEVLNAGWVVYLMSHSMMAGFVSAAAALIVASQIPGALGGASADLLSSCAVAVGDNDHFLTFEFTAISCALTLIASRSLRTRRTASVCPGAACSSIRSSPDSAAFNAFEGRPRARYDRA